MDRLATKTEITWHNELWFGKKMFIVGADPGPIYYNMKNT